MSTIHPVPPNYPPEITGYAEPWIVNAGDQVAIKISCTEPEYKSRTVHVLQGYEGENSPPRVVKEISEIPSEIRPGRFQLANPGSWAELPPLLFGESDPEGIRVTFYAQPWLVACEHVQTFVSTLDTVACTGFAVVLGTDGVFQVWMGTGEKVEVLKTEFIAEKLRWIGVVVEVEDRTVRLQVTELEDGLVPPGRVLDQTFELDVSAKVRDSTTELLLAASRAVSSSSTTVTTTTTTTTTNSEEEKGLHANHFNGRLEAVKFETFGTPPPRILAHYDFSRDISSDTILDISGHERHGRLLNAPTRAIKGYNWPGTEVDWTKNCQHYGAIHFHDDDLDDAKWQTDFTITVPVTARSGVYAVEIESTDGKAQDMIPFFVRPSDVVDALPLHQPKVALVASTFTYLAYANEHMWDPNSPARAEVPDDFGSFQFHRDEDFAKLVRRSDLGLSCYDVHSDGSGVIFSSSKRPLLNHRPGYINWTGHRPREISAELLMVGFLDRLGIMCDVLTDHDLHFRGVAALQRYQVVVTGCHPEYPTLQSYTAYEEFLRQGGKLMYLGGNGFYWSSALHPTLNPHRLEVRRGGQGVRTSHQQPGERHFSNDGLVGGLWRDRGKAANYLVGIGCCGEGAGPGVPYRMSPTLPQEFPLLYANIFAGVFHPMDNDNNKNDADADAQKNLFTFGHNALGGFGGGASADEIDRADVQYGSPRQLVVLASSTGHSDRFGLFPEDVHFPMMKTLGTQTNLIRSDMTFHETAGGGAVFSVGSISWYVALGWQDYDNDVARITANVLRMFLGGDGGGGGGSKL